MNLAYTHKKPKAKLALPSVDVSSNLNPIYICIVAIDTETERCYCNGWVMFYQFVESEISRSLNLICLNEMKKLDSNLLFNLFRICLGK